MKLLYSILFALIAVLCLNNKITAQDSTDLLPNVTVQPLYNPDGEAFGEPVIAAQMRFDWLGISSTLLFGPMLPPNSTPVSFMIAIPEEDVESPAEEKPHRGRIQIQGPDMSPELSWAWAQDTPPTKAEALAKLDELVGQLTAKQKEAREDAIKKLRKFIEEAPEAGIDAQYINSWGNDKDPKKRFDIEVRKGKAFTGKPPKHQPIDDVVEPLE
jgi:hypothetical protein